LFEVEAQPTDTTSLQDKIDDLRNNAQEIANKLRDVKGDRVTNQYIVVLKNNVLSYDSIRSLTDQAVNQGAALRHIYDHALDGFAIRVPDEKVLDSILKIPQVDFVEPDIKVEAFAQSLPTGVDRADGDLSSTKSGDGNGVVNVDIGIMDTGIDLNHPDLNVYSNVTFVAGTISGNDDNGHGTSVAGIAAAKDDFQGVVGLAPGARLWSIKVLDSNGIGLISDIIKGIDYATQHANEIDVVNLSFGGDGSSTALRIAIIKSVGAGVTYAAAAGNDAKDASSVIPASFPEVIAVSAIVDTDGKCGGISTPTTAGNDDTLADFSNFGTVVDMAAPGVLIKTTTKASSYTSSFSGTSASTPHVTGAAALYQSENSGATPSDIRNALRSIGSSPSTICDGNGHGYFTGDKDNDAEPLLYSGTSNSPPTANSQVALTGKDTSKRIAITASDPDNNPLTYSIVTAPQHGTITGGTGQVRTYTPTAGYTGPDSFTFRANDGSVNSNTATVSISVVDPASCPGSIPVSSVFASGNDGNVPSNVLDNNLNTRWSNLGQSWIAADLGSSKDICTVDIAWYLGNQREYAYLIIASDGNTWRDVFSGSTTVGTIQVNRANTANSEKNFIPPTNARYIGIIAAGLSNSLVGITEVDIFSPSLGLSGSYQYDPSLSLSGPPN
jgi:subtilisin family serine protease